MKLDDINHEYSQKLDYTKLVSAKNAEEALLKYKRECEARYKANLDLEV